MMSQARTQIPVLELSGTPSQLGEGHGEQQRSQIQEYSERFLEWLLRHASCAQREQEVWEKWSPQVAYNERVAPHLVEEMRGIARGADVSFERIFLLNSILDLVSFCYLEMGVNFGCTSFAVSHEPGTARTLVGQTYDMPELHQDYLVLLRLTPEQGPRQLVFSFAGVVGAGGLNEAGIGLSINFLSCRDVGMGKLHSCVVREVLASANLGEALTAPVVPPRAGGAHYLVADDSGSVVSVETTGKQFQAIYPQDNVYGHTNHYLTAGLKEREVIRPQAIGSSLARYASLSRYFREKAAQVDLTQLQELTRNHTSFPRSICAHGSASEATGFRSRTLAAMVHVLNDRVMHVTGGCACENEYVAVTL